MNILKTLIVFCLFVHTQRVKSQNKPPNVVIIYADDMGYGDLAANGWSDKIPTPNLDQLAAKGMRFTDGHSSSGICSPSRFAILSGQHHWRRGIHNVVKAFHSGVLKSDDFTLGKMFQTKGYNTAAIGKWHLGWGWDAIKVPNPPKVPVTIKGRTWTVYTEKAFDWSKPIPGGPTARGFDYYFGDDVINFPPYCFIENDKVLKAPTRMFDISLLGEAPGEGTWGSRDGPMAEGWDPYKVLPTVTDKAVKWIEKQKKDQPFFMYFALPSPHEPVIPNKEYIGKSKAGPYGDFVVETDAMAGRVIQALKDGGFEDNTVVIFTADNGAEKLLYERQKKYKHWSSGQFRGSKRDLWEGGHHVPFLISWPDVIKPGSLTNQTINQVDLAATFAAMIGYNLKTDEAQDSYNFLPLLKGHKYNKPLRKATVQNTRANGYVLRQGDWLYINQKGGGHVGYIPGGVKPPKFNTPGLLFNLKEDPSQTKNLYSQYPEKVTAMATLLKEYINGKSCAPHAQK